MTIPADTVHGGRVCVIDDDPEVRGSLGSLFRSASLGVALFENTDTFMTAAPSDLPSCLVLDIRLRGEDGIEFQEKLRGRGIAIPVILITGHGDIPMTVRGMKAGAIDFLPKPFNDEQMLSAVTAALDLDRMRRLQVTEIAKIQKLYDSLTPREQEVMAFVVTGLMNKQIAGRMDLSEITVKIHRGNVMRKTGAQSLADLVRMAEMLQIRDTTVTRFNTSV